MSYSQSRQDSSGTLKTTISLGRTPAIVHSGPFYLMKEPPESSELTGATNLITHHRLSSTYLKLLGKKKNDLSTFLHNMTDVNVPIAKNDLNCTLQSLLETRIIGNKEILPMTDTQSIGFRLFAGAPLPAQYRLFNQIVHKKHKKHKKKQRSQTHESHGILGEGSGSLEASDPALVERKKREKKKEKKKDKKDKKDKREKRKIHGQASGNDE